MGALDRAACVKLIEKDYFGSVAASDMGAVRRCFTEDATVIIRHGDAPVRKFRINPQAPDELPLMEGFYGHLCGNYSAWFGEFEHTIDVEQQRAASRFSVALTPLPDGDYADAGVQRLKNCNFFEFSEGLIRWMMIYYSNPEGTSSNPTGYGKGAGQ